jgi:hypothetical protein
MSDIVDFRIDQLPDLETFKERSEALAHEIDQKEKLVAAVGWEAVRDTACRKLTEGLASQGAEAWFTWLAKAWTLSRKLKEAGAETLADAEAERVIPLASHPLKHVIQPVVTLVCDPLEFALTFDLELKAEIDSADLVVRGGRLVAVQAARLTPSAALRYGDVALGEKKGKPIELAQPFLLPNGGLKLVDEPPEAVAAE